MVPVIIVVVIVVLAAVAFAIVRRGTSAGEPSGGSSGDVTRPRAPYREFHVSGNSALVYFDVPLPEGEPDPVLADLLVREAVEVLREKQSHALPLDDVTEVKAFGTRGGEDAEAGSISLETPGMLPDMDHVEVVPHFSSVPFDPLARLGEQEHSAPATAAPDISSTTDDGTPALKPLAEELALTGRIDAGLRAQGLDPATMGAGDLALGLMRMAGYTIADGNKADTYVVSAPGSRTYVRVVRHDPGDYPELGEQDIKEFQIGLASAGTDRGLLITEKFGPYMIYESERRNPKAKFITRERLQDFVDGFSMS